MELELGAHRAPMTLRERYRALCDELAEVQRAAGSSNVPVTIVAVTKKQPREAVLAAIEVGLADVGENYYQEAREKLAGLPPVRKHFLGHVQTNKARGIVEQFDMVQTVDRFDAGHALAKAARTLGKTLPVLVQVNISPSERFGADPEQAERLADQLRNEGLQVDGVMAIGPLTQDRDDLQRAFERAANAFSLVGGTTLSLGMSGDWQHAVECGSTMIRVGTSLFGPRSGTPQTRGNLQ
ncbi:MAG: YggS family pyridoxal phosphate-dependent enzyme [Candidatus Eremiobacteraeota bacterium]|nr:YggS family pyridoxal phosphate-dependent enzyme [Candidatus Eremiobacteraeota bacterium]